MLLIKRGHTEQVQDSEVVSVLPSVFVDLAETARLEGGGEAVSVEVTAACPVGSEPQQSSVNIGQPQASGQGVYVPICDGQQHTFTVRVAATTGQFQTGSANSGAVGVVTWRGNTFYGQDIQQLQIV